MSHFLLFFFVGLQHVIVTLGDESLPKDFKYKQVKITVKNSLTFTL